MRRSFFLHLALGLLSWSSQALGASTEREVPVSLSNHLLRTHRPSRKVQLRSVVVEARSDRRCRRASLNWMNDGGPLRVSDSLTKFRPPDAVVPNPMPSRAFGELNEMLDATARVCSDSLGQAYCRPGPDDF
jgi:hypothetical protein